jgi:hypothetical protein
MKAFRGQCYLLECGKGAIHGHGYPRTVLADRDTLLYAWLCVSSYNSGSRFKPIFTCHNVSGSMLLDATDALSNSRFIQVGRIQGF